MDSPLATRVIVEDVRRVVQRTRRRPRAAVWVCLPPPTPTRRVADCDTGDARAVAIADILGTTNLYVLHCRNKTRTLVFRSARSRAARSEVMPAASEAPMNYRSENSKVTKDFLS